MIRVLPLWLVLAHAAGAEPLQPAELPGPDYAGLQYVDSKGCLFARAGNGSEVQWIPRVSRGGVQVCTYPPSGQRVAVVEEGGVQPLPRTQGEGAEASDPGLFVEVGRFSGAVEAEKAERRLKKLDYVPVRGHVLGNDGAATVIIVGPFASTEAAKAAVRALRKKGFRDAALSGP